MEDLGTCCSGMNPFLYIQARYAEHPPAVIGRGVTFVNLILPISWNTAGKGLWIALLATFASGDVVFDPPRAIRVVSMDRKPLRILASGLDRSGIHGSQGLVSWEAIRAREARQLWLKVMDRKQGEDWLDAAWVLLVHPAAEKEDLRMAREFLAEASRRLPDGEARVEALRSDSQAYISDRNSRLAREEAQRIHLLGPEARSWSAEPWPAGEVEVARRSRDLHAWLNQRLQDIDSGVESTEVSDRRIRKSRHALIASDEPRQDLMAIGLQVDALVNDLNQLLGNAPDNRIFAPRAAILVCSQSANHEQFVRDVLQRPLEVVMFEPIGSADSDVAIFVDGSDVSSAMSALRHQLVHAWMHRHYSPRRPPAWFNEGLAHAMAWWRTSPPEQPWRSTAISYLRKPGSAEALLSRPYGAGNWAMNGTDTAAAGLLVRRMLEENPRQVAAWIDRVKRGEDIDEAFEDSIGATPSRAVARQVRYWMLND